MLTFNGQDNVFNKDELPKCLYVQAADRPSFTSQDVELKLTAEGKPGVMDFVHFTVLWVEIACRHDGQLSADNRNLRGQNDADGPHDARGFYIDHNLAHTDGLGVPIIWLKNEPATTFSCSRGSEFVGTVFPPDFKPAAFKVKLHLSRDVVEGRYYQVVNGQEWDPVRIPPDIDESGEHLRDDDPQSDNSQGKIYDFDVPGIGSSEGTKGDTMRLRVNFKAYAVFYMRDGAGISRRYRCSNYNEWCTRQSYVFDKTFESGAATSLGANTLADSTKIGDSAWVPNNKWVPGGVVLIQDPTHTQAREIQASSSNQLTVKGNWLAPAAPGNQYRIFTDSNWKPINDLSQEDNKSKDGTTKLTKDLK
jgi:hypothetical protein